MAAEWLFYELSALPVLLLQLTVLIHAFSFLWNVSRTSAGLLTDLEDICEAMDRIPRLRADTIWYPRNVAAVAAVYQISPEEVNNEYQKEIDAKKWIVNNTFPDNGLTKKLVDGVAGTRFIKTGYDYGDTLPPSRASHNSNGSSVNKSDTNLEKSSDTQQPKKSTTDVRKSKTNVAKSTGRSKSSTNSSAASNRRRP